MYARAKPKIFISSAAISIIFANILVFTLHALDYPSSWYIFDFLILEPTKFQHLDLWLASWQQLVTTTIAIFGYSFLHVNFGHLFFNMLMLLAFGTPLARTLSKKALLTVYFVSMPICAIIPLLSGTGALGASGSISGVLGCLTSVALFQPHRFHEHNPKVRASSIVYSAVFWLALNVVFALFPEWSSEIVGQLLYSDNSFIIGWEIHIAGFLTGLVLGVIILLFYRTKR